jgi:hypothetical protein
MLYYNYEDITVEVLNKVVSNQKVLITESELERLKKMLRSPPPLQQPPARAGAGRS